MVSEEMPDGLRTRAIDALRDMIRLARLRGFDSVSIAALFNHMRSPEATHTWDAASVEAVEGKNKVG